MAHKTGAIVCAVLGFALIGPVAAQAHNSQPEIPSLVLRVATLENQLRALEVRLQAGDANLDSRITALQAALVAEVQNRTQGDAGLDSRDTALQVALGAEGTARVQGDANLQSALNNALARINGLQTRLDGVEGDITVLENAARSFPAPDFDSHWRYPLPGETIITHNLGTREIIVYMTGMSGTLGIHQRYYGGNTYHIDGVGGINNGAFWKILNENQIVIVRTEDATDQWAVARVQIWKIPG